MPTIELDDEAVLYLSERDWRLAHLIAHVGPLTYRTAGTCFEALAHSIIEQMLTMKAGDVIRGRLIEKCGGILTPEAVGALSQEEIRACGMSRTKARSLHALADYALEHDLDELAALPDEEVRAELMALPGIGKWTADMYLLFYLGREDILPVEDAAVRQVFTWLYRAPMTDRDVVTAVCDVWHPHCSTAVRYMYRALNTGLLKLGDSRDVLGY